MQIQEAALDIFITRGYGEMSMDEVARASGVSKRTLYEHFPSKLELALACIRSLPDWGGWGEGKDDLDTRLMRALNAGASYQIRAPRVLATCLTHKDDTPELLDTFLHDVLEPRVESMREFIDHGIAFGDIRPDADPAVALAIIMGVLTFNDVGLLNMGKGGPKLARKVADMILPYLRVES